MANPEVGKTYEVNHARKGEFVLAITAVNDEWITGNLIEGEPRYLLDCNKRIKGEELTIRRSFCNFKNLEVTHG